MKIMAIKNDLQTNNTKISFKMNPKNAIVIEQIEQFKNGLTPDLLDRFTKIVNKEDNITLNKLKIGRLGGLIDVFHKIGKRLEVKQQLLVKPDNVKPLEEKMIDELSNISAGKIFDKNLPTAVSDIC